MSVGKRKRYSKHLRCVFFPDDVKDHVDKGRRETSLSATSAAKSWERCGDSFLDTPVIKNLHSSGRKLSSVKKLVQSLPSGRTPAQQCDEDPVHIAWSSSDSEQCDTEVQRAPLPLASPQQGLGKANKPPASVQSYSRALRMLSTQQEEFPDIDWASDVSDNEHNITKTSRDQISDSDSTSEVNDEQPKPRQPVLMTDPEISDYASDGEWRDDALSHSRLETESSPLPTGEGSRRSVSDWVRSAQAMLQTPQKQVPLKPKTPEDSTNKKRKFQSRGLAERLNRLHCRQRSAISFWRHQFLSHNPAPTVNRPGVLVLEVLSVQEECSMQLAHCKQHQTPGEAHHSPPPHVPEARVLVLFNKETAAQLMPAPRDVIHIYPPWQSLRMENDNSTIILNTHFSQRVCSEFRSDHIPRALHPVEKCSPCSLTRLFGLLGMNKTSEEDGSAVKKVIALQAPSCSTTSWGGSRHCESLLEAIEGLGQAGSVGQDVVVMVQRVYSVRVHERSSASVLKSKVPGRTPSPPLLHRGKTRLCALVQDGYGTFSVIQLHLLPAEEDQLQRYGREWQGRTCVLRAVKVVQRVTRERCTRLFNLIDSLWPPLIAPKVHGDTSSCPSERRAPGAAPSFCYMLSGQEGSVFPVEGQDVSCLYLPPEERTLRDIVKSDLKGNRCSFIATVIYKRTESDDLSQGDIWLVLTDPSLQADHAEGPQKRTQALCVSAACVLAPSVVRALSSPSAPCLSFRDAVMEHGVLLCVEQTVVQVHSAGPEVAVERSTSLESPCHPPLVLAQAPALALPHPLKLDSLGPETTPNSLCTITGVIVGVDENTAYSWPTCSQCGSDSLEVAEGQSEAFHCVSCDTVVEKPTVQMQLEVILSSPLSNCTVKVKLLRSTIFSLLNSAASEANQFPGYEVENVLGRELGPLTAYVRVVTRKPAALWMGLEEICLLRPSE